MTETANAGEVSGGASSSGEASPGGAPPGEASPGDKGLPETGSDLLADVSLPAAVVHEPALAHNLAWMQRFAEAHGAYLAPHGKTTMAPALFQRQLDAGAWGITLATAPQCRAAFAAGVTRLLMANQLIGRANMAIVAELLAAGAEFCCVVDGADNVRELGAFFAERGQTLDVLIELGVPGGRTGCRTPAQVEALARRVAAEPALRLIGLEGYEGVVQAADPVSAVRDYAARLVEAARRLDRAGHFPVDTPIITAAGSAWYDLVAEVFEASGITTRFTPVLRPGCYVVHDHGIYREAQQGVLARRPGLHEGLRPALEVFAQIQSLPEPGLAIAALGKRDIGADSLPVPLRRFREGGRADQPLDVTGWRVTRLMDQHAFLALPAGGGDVCVGDMRVGDIVAFGASHPCLTFDKWRRVLRVDGHLAVQEVMETRF